MRRSASPRHRSHKINLSFGAVLGRCAAQNRTKRRPKCRVLCAVKRAYRITKANVPIVKFEMTHDTKISTYLLPAPLNLSKGMQKRGTLTQHAATAQILLR